MPNGLKNFNSYKVGGFAAFFLLGLLVGYFWPGRIKTVTAPNIVSSIRLSNNPYKFVAPLLGIDVGEPKDFTEFKPFESKLNSLISDLQSKGKVSDVGIYFRDYKNGHWVGINENQQFYPASLLKVPLMIAYYKESETDSSLLAKHLLYDGKVDANSVEYIKPAKSIIAGQSYSVEELIEYMIKYSDNNAANLLLANLDQNSFNEVYSDLGISLPDETQTEADFLTPKQYSLFFRILRNGTYLTDQLSEQALQLLSQTDYDQGLVAGVPQGTVVSSKFGEHLLLGSNGQQTEEFHDCGIVYVAQNPYLLCVMTKGKNYSDLEGTIKSISSLTYEEVTNNFQ